MVLDDSNWSYKAWMSKKDADLIEHILVRKSHETSDDVLDVLEWGSGRSTIYYTDLLKKLGANFRWISVEYDRDYFQGEITRKIANGAVQIFKYEKLSSDFDLIGSGLSNIVIVLFNYGKLSPFLDDHIEDRNVKMDDYVEFPRKTKHLFDVIIVDGRKRRRCILESSRLLKKGGVVLLHDAYRTYYHCAFTSFKAKMFIGDILWIGSNQRSSFQNLEEN